MKQLKLTDEEIIGAISAIQLSLNSNWIRSRTIDNRTPETGKIREAISVEDQRPKDLYQINGADSLAAILAAQKEKKEFERKWLTGEITKADK